MRLAISNIAWDISEDELVAGLLKRYAIDAIDIAPGKYFPDPAKASALDILAVKCWWLDRGIEITGMQALLFGTTGLNVFGSADSQNALLRHLNEVCRIASGLGATRLVFGSPKNRDRSGLSDQAALEIAIDFFRRLGAVAQEHSVLICLEPNPACYGSNFMTSSAETRAVVESVAHPKIRMQLDTGAITINAEVPSQVIGECAGLIGHVHASEPSLLTLGDGGTAHAEFADALEQILPEQVVSIEMVATDKEDHIISIERALTVACRYYRKSESIV
ncbi:sugar phosphate isomerase/epimerase [Pseudomonas nitroreducens]|uniref:Sugar phosphate isomerase/epimerase n=1 Tax=Pseudomonas nitroreducens TaxID=46680 RepID=A0A5R9A7P9_PSENT|nr:sugar phosphate isomerase/epimerase [Pseudomonas nitroreducens]TLP74713.1 sugar phosphate isomerase/epimerase [Pseudomonas nitroreducens]